MGRRSRYTIKSEINIVPLLDVLLVLVLIFMATAPIISQSVEVDLPKATVSKTIDSSNNKPIIIEVSAIGKYALVINQIREESLPKEQIVERIKQQLKLNDKSIFLIGGAKDVPYEEIINALNILQEAGVQSVGLMTDVKGKSAK